MVEFKLKNGKFLEDGHTMFKEDVLSALKRLNFLEHYKNNLTKVIDKHFWDWDNHNYTCIYKFLEDLDKIAKGNEKFASSEKSE